MFETIRTVALCALVGVGTLAAIPATAQADGLYLNFGGHGDSRFGVYSGDRDRGFREHRRNHERRRSCTPERALDKAERMGLNRVRVVDAGRRTVTVAGRKFGNRVTVTFGNERGCPIYYR